MPYTTIQITEETRKKLAKLKTYVRGTYDDVLNTLLDLVPSSDDEGEYTEEFKASLLRALSDIKHGRVYSTEEVRRKLGLKS
jgi:O6-methylguanine-DNA--protein-cysteine methyltransferase